MKVSCNVEYEIISVNSSDFVTIKSNSHFDGIFLPIKKNGHDSVTMSNRYLENTDLLRYAHLPDVVTFYYTVFKNHIHIVTTLIRKMVKYWEAVRLMVADTSLPKF